MGSFDAEVNNSWMEALDVGTGRFYFIRLATNETSWERPAGFLDRKDLVRAHAEVLASTSTAAPAMDDATFLARVRERFPPPAMPPKANDGELQALKARVAALEGENASLQTSVAEARTEKTALEQTIETLQLSMGAAPPSCVAPPSFTMQTSANRGSLTRLPPALGTLDEGGKPPSWKRGASARFANAEPPPPPPAWAVQMSRGASAYGSGHMEGLNRRQSTNL